MVVLLGQAAEVPAGRDVRGEVRVGSCSRKKAALQVEAQTSAAEVVAAGAELAVRTAPVVEAEGAGAEAHLPD